jgi:spore maturation protein CgeB
VKVVLYGEAHLIGSGAYCYSETLKQLGHEVILVRDDSGLQWYTTPFGRVARKALGRISELHRRRHVAELRHVVRQQRPELVIVLKGLFIGAEDVRAMRAAGAFVTIINHDDFFSLNSNNWSAVQRAALPFYDYVFVTREVNVAEVARVNPNVEFFPFAYYPGIHRSVEIPEDERARFESDVVFVGTWEAERCQLLEYLVQRVPARYAIWGSHWSRAGRLSPVVPFIVGRDALMDDQCKAIGGSKIALAFLRRLNRDDYTQRTFEIPACGGLLLGERTARQQSYYREGVEAEFFDPNCPDELVDKVRMLLADPQRRDAIREAGRRALERQHHTYRDRLLRVFELYPGQHSLESGQL